MLLSSPCRRASCGAIKRTSSRGLGSVALRRLLRVDHCQSAFFEDLVLCLPGWWWTHAIRDARVATMWPRLGIGTSSARRNRTGALTAAARRNAVAASSNPNMSQMVRPGDVMT